MVMDCGLGPNRLNQVDGVTCPTGKTIVPTNIFMLGAFTVTYYVIHNHSVKLIITSQDNNYEIVIILLSVFVFSSEYTAPIYTKC